MDLGAIKSEFPCRYNNLLREVLNISKNIYGKPPLYSITEITPMSKMLFCNLLVANRLILNPFSRKRSRHLSTAWKEILGNQSLVNYICLYCTSFSMDPFRLIKKSKSGGMTASKSLSGNSYRLLRLSMIFPD